MEAATDRAPVIIAGAGPCGLMCALVLQHEGIPSVLVERVEEEKVTANVGSGLDMFGTSMRIFGRLGLPSEQFLLKYAATTMVGPTGSVVRTINSGGWATQRSELQAALKTALDMNLVTVRFGVEVSAYSETEDTVNVELTDGSSITGRALLACDGWKSRIRAQMLLDDPVHFCNISMWWGMCKETPQLVAAGFEKADFMYSMPSPKNPGMWCCNPTTADVCWCVGAPAATDPDSSDDLTRRGGVRGEGVKEEVSKLMADRGDLITALINSTDAESVTKVGLYDRQKLDQPFVSPGGRVALLGDAAHPQTPFLGQGCNMALADAFVTCTRLAHQDVRTALAALDDPKRKAFCKEVVENARYQGTSETQAPSRLTGCMANMYMKCAPQVILKAGIDTIMIFDKGNKEFVDQALTDCGLSL